MTAHVPGGYIPTPDGAPPLAIHLAADECVLAARAGGWWCIRADRMHGAPEAAHPDMDGLLAAPRSAPNRNSR